MKKQWVIWECKKISRKKRGNNCETEIVALKEETWTHKQKNLDQH